MATMTIESATTPGEHYLVDIDRQDCTCRGFHYRGVCRHLTEANTEAARMGYFKNSMSDQDVDDLYPHGAQAEPEPEAPADALADVLARLAKPVPARFVETRKGPRGMNLSYVNVWTLRRIFDHYTGGRWSKAIALTVAGDWITVTVSLTVWDAHGVSAVRAAAGSANVAEGVDGKDPATLAEAQATRRAFAQFGLGAHLWE